MDSPLNSFDQNFEEQQEYFQEMGYEIVPTAIYFELLSSLEYLLRNFDSEKNSAGAIIRANEIIKRAKQL